MAISATRRAFLVGAASAPLLARPALTQARFPSRLVKIVIGFPPGGGIDILARLMAPKMAERLGQSVIVENRPGANGLIATQGVAQAEPDGHTILFGTTGNLAVNPVLYARPGLDMERDFVPLSQVASLPFVLVVNPSVPANSLKELIDLAKSRPGEISFGSSGNGGLPHLSGELLSLQAGIRTLHVPYRGSAPAFTDLISGQVQFVFDALAIAQPHIEGGKLRALATTGPKRTMKALPAMAELLPGYEVTQWYGILVPAGTPKDIVARLHKEISGAVANPKHAQALVRLGTQPVTTTPEEFAAFIRSETAKYAKVIKAAGIAPE
jgi:tripartite-type tricarboxylate transporter receptor subunit TctC